MKKCPLKDRLSLILPKYGLRFINLSNLIGDTFALKCKDRMLSLPIKITFMKKIYLLFVFFAVVNSAIGQEKEGKFFEIGLEFQLYPTGYLAAVRGEVGLAPHHAVDFRVGYNGLDHGDNGVHNTEEGGGLGGSLGYRYYFNPAHKKWFIGARADLWNNDIDLSLIHI